MENLRCVRGGSVQLFVQFFTQLNCTVYLRVYGALKKETSRLLRSLRLCLCPTT